jgi:hypothetical protein
MKVKSDASRKELAVKHPIRILAAAATVFVAMGAATSKRSGGYDHAQMQLDINMTQAMSTPGASGPMQNGQVADAQLQRSKDPGYVQALGQHEADINRMLGIAP